MSVIEFPYLLHKGIFVPIIPIQIKCNNEWFQIWAFVDSGATFSLFSMDVAEGIGLDLKNSLQRYIVVGDGSFIPALFVKMYVKIGDEEILAELGFSNRLGIGFNLLGRKDIFEKFKICFSDSNKQLTFQTIE